MGDVEQELQAIKKLLIVSLLQSGISPKAIEKATGIAAKTIRNTYPISLIKKSK